ncbi:MAG TPA: gluconokinase [Streptosporangiaceae bacterium]|nr:gluconokinase [Streptosporangiaceae bacterium]
MIVVVAGVAGSGKTTVGQLLAGQLGWTFTDGDAFHPAANVAKMRAGLPLTDADREPWLAAIGAWMDDIADSGQSAVLACSALKRRYRDELLYGRDHAEMVFLLISEEEDHQRLAMRAGHFFHEPLLASQFADLELPQDEPRVHLITVGKRPAGQVATEVIKLLGLAPAGHPQAS